ncbi:DUF2161 domain-containing phosphodiesterase [Paenibacillus campi]|uniref:DUF2161 domain-containing phosphodiesterase n=1 Tax=Paenibacillus campi TaxID=3106031 RepID=UPI002AFE0291|nr:DUF2161 family putative PD-(D/E)XK-type phosphodiesterase [Paenibacillus sp. SGZ-1014]
MAVQRETELYLPIKHFFVQQGYEVKGEVRHCDLVGIKHNESEPLIIEIKKTFNLALLLQGIERQKLSSNVYVAVERNRLKKGAVNQRWSELVVLCERLGLGLITVTFYKTKAPLVEVLCQPARSSASIVQPRKGSRRERLLREVAERSGDYNLGGSSGVPLVTAYREKALHVAQALGTREGISPRELREQSGVPSAAAIMQANYYGWFERIAHGSYRLSSAGKQALDDYRHIMKQMDK